MTSMQAALLLVAIVMASVAHHAQGAENSVSRQDAVRLLLSLPEHGFD